MIGTSNVMGEVESREIINGLNGEARITFLYHDDSEPTVEMIGEFNERELEAVVLGLKRMREHLARGK